MDKKIKEAAGAAAVNVLEERVQADCFIWHWNHMVKERGRLFMVHNNAKNRMEGSKLMGMGLVKGVSDMVYLVGPGCIAFLECKLPGRGQDPEQVQFQRMVEALGWDYKIFHSLDEFKKIIHDYKNKT